MILAFLCHGSLETNMKTVKKAAKRKVNREGQLWTEDRPGMTLRLTLDIREAIWCASSNHLLSCGYFPTLQSDGLSLFCSPELLFGGSTVPQGS
jgi:hypothetical protein